MLRQWLLPNSYCKIQLPNLRALEICLFLRVFILPSHLIMLILSPRLINYLPGYRILHWKSSFLRFLKPCSLVLQDPLLLLRSLKATWFLMRSMSLVFLSRSLQDSVFIPTVWNLTMMCLICIYFHPLTGYRVGPFNLEMHVLWCWKIMLSYFIEYFLISASFVCISYNLDVRLPIPAVLNHAPRLILRFLKNSYFYF